MISGILISLTYGIPTKPENDPLVHLAEEAMAASATGAIPGKFLVDVFPLLKYIPEWFPGASFQRIAREWKELWQRFISLTFQAAEANIVSLISRKSSKFYLFIRQSSGSAERSFVSASLDAVDENQDIEKQKVAIKETAVTFIAGTVQKFRSNFGVPLNFELQPARTRLVLRSSLLFWL